MEKNYFTKSEMVKHFPLTMKQVRLMFLSRGFPKEIIRIRGRKTECVEGSRLIGYLNCIF